MNDFQREIYKTIDRLTEEKLRGLGFDKTKRGKVVSVNGTNCVVEIDGEDYSCKLRRGIYIEPNDIVFVKFPQDNSVDKYVDTILGGNETPVNLVISAQEILDKLKTIDGAGSGLDADLLDGKHASEFVTLDDLGDIDVDISGEAIVTNINASQSIIDDKNLSENVNDAIDKKHSHTNKSTIDNIKQDDIDTWNTVTNKSDKIYVDNKLDDKVDKVEGKGLSEENYSTSEKSKLAGISNNANKVESSLINGNIKIDNVEKNVYTHPSGTNPHGTTKSDIGLSNVENKSSATIRSEITSANITGSLGYTPENSSNKGVANGYAPLDSNIKIPLSMLPDIAKQQTYVVETIAGRDNLSSLIMGEKCYVTNTGDSYIWDGDSWEILAKADWENVNLQWTNIVGKPNSNVSDIDDATSKRHTHSNKSIIDTVTQTLIDRWNSAWTHISDTIKHITSAERTKWNTVDNKADTTYVNTELNKKVDKIVGKQLSTEDYTTTEKNKLSGIESGANKYILPIASETILGGIKVGANLTITADGTLSAADSDERSTFITKQEIFVATEGQTVFNLTKGNYKPNTNTLSVYLYGGKQPNTILNEISSTSFEITLPLKDGDIVIVEYIELSSATPYPIHGSDHLSDGYDPIPLVTASKEGLMSKGDKSKLDGIENGANKYVHPGTHPASIITESSSRRFVSDSEKTTWNTVTSKADKNYVDTELGNKVDNSRVLTDVPLNAKFTDTNTTYSEITTTEIDAGTSSTSRVISGRRVQYILDKVGTMISTAIGALNKSSVGLSNVDNTSDLSKPISTATQTALDGKVNNSQVLTNVPSGAKFTDTIYDHPSSHPASMITESTSRRFASDVEKATWNNKAEISDIPTKVSELTNDSNYVTQGELGDAGFGDMVKAIYDTNNNGIVDNAEKVNGFTVDTNVPANAKFTDTIYTHPSSHPASMITESTTKRFVSDTEKSTWNNKANTSDIPDKFIYVGTTSPANNQMGWIDTSL